MHLVLCLGTERRANRQAAQPCGVRARDTHALGGALPLTSSAHLRQLRLGHMPRRLRQAQHRIGVHAELARHAAHLPRAQARGLGFRARGAVDDSLARMPLGFYNHALWTPTLDVQ
jgi:hypothetical protein